MATAITPGPSPRGHLRDARLRRLLQDTGARGGNKDGRRLPSLERIGAGAGAVLPAAAAAATTGTARNIRSHRSAPGICRYYDLVTALLTEEGSAATRLWREITQEAAQPADFAVLPFVAETLGDDAARYQRMFTIGLAFARPGDDALTATVSQSAAWPCSTPFTPIGRPRSALNSSRYLRYEKRLLWTSALWQQCQRSANCAIAKGNGMPPTAGMLKWGQDNAIITESIRAQKSILKIILKTKDEEYFLSRWYAHHAKLVPPSSIIILDNNSTNKICLDFYSGISNNTNIITFDGLHNNVHDTRIFDSFYDALKDSCKYFVFLDTDEFLFYYDSGRLLCDRSISENLAIATTSVYPAIWIENMPGSDRVYRVTEEALNAGVRWGKPIILAATTPIGYINHNSQIPASHYDAEVDFRHVILHLSKLSTRQRVDINIHKLKQRSFFTSDNYLHEVMQASCSNINNRHIRAYVAEIQEIVKNPFEERRYNKLDIPASSDMMCVDLNSGAVTFYDGSQRELLDSYLTKDTARADILRPAAEGVLDNQGRRLNVTSLTMQPHMTRREIELLKPHLEKANFLLEFGSGGSTVMAAALGVQKIVSVDSNNEWLQKVSEAPELRGCNFRACHVDIGKLAKWGNPADKASALKWPAYYTAVWAELGEQPDVVLIDGRFRVACTLATLLYCGRETKIVIHDFWNRAYYREVLSYLECVDKVDQIGIFYPKADVDLRRLAKSMLNYVLDYR